MNLARALERSGAAATLTPDTFMEKLRNFLYARRSRGTGAAGACRAGSFPGITAPEGERESSPMVFTVAIDLCRILGEMDVDAAIAALAQDPLGAYRLESQRVACAQWPRAPTRSQHEGAEVTLLFPCCFFQANWTR